MHEGADKKSWRWSLGIVLALVAGVLAIYGQTLAFDFAGYDDDQYMVGNASVKKGLSWEGLSFSARTCSPASSRC